MRSAPRVHLKTSLDSNTRRDLISLTYPGETHWLLILETWPMRAKARGRIPPLIHVQKTSSSNWLLSYSDSWRTPFIIILLQIPQLMIYLLRHDTMWELAINEQTFLCYIEGYKNDLTILFTVVLWRTPFITVTLISNFILILYKIFWEFTISSIQKVWVIFYKLCNSLSF